MRARKSSSRQAILTPEAKPVESQERGMARKVLSPSVQAGLSVRAIHEGSISNLEIRPLVRELSDQMQAIGDGMMARAEEMLVAQAHTLDALFNRLTRLAVGHIGDPEVVGPYLKLALKSQSQCRATVETLAEMKNPKPVNFVQQANIGQNVQVNNGDQGAARERSEHEQNKLLGENDGKRLDTGTTGAAIRGDSALEAVGKIDRAENR